MPIPLMPPREVKLLILRSERAAEGLSKALQSTLLLNHPNRSSGGPSVLGIPWFEYQNGWDDDLFVMEFEHWHKFRKEVKASVYYEPFKQFRDANSLFRLAGREFKIFFPEFWPRGGGHSRYRGRPAVGYYVVGGQAIRNHEHRVPWSSSRGGRERRYCGYHSGLSLPRIIAGPRRPLQGDRRMLHPRLDGRRGHELRRCCIPRGGVPVTLVVPSFSTVTFGWHCLNSVSGDRPLRLSFRLTEIAARFTSALYRITRLQKNCTRPISPLASLAWETATGESSHFFFNNHRYPPAAMPAFYVC
jgi:hypothetical protein